MTPAATNQSLDVPRVAVELVRLAQEGQTGVLEVRAEGLVTIVYFESGTPVFAEEGTLGESLGRVLVRQGKLTQQQYAAVIHRMTRSVMENEQARFGEVAVALGFITAEEVADGLREQVRAKVGRCLQWQDAELLFRPDAEAVAEVSHFPCSVPRVLWYGLRRLFDPARCREVWGERGPEQYPDVSVDRVAMAEMLDLGAEERLFLNLVDGTRTAEMLVQSSPLDVVLATQLLTALLILGAVVLRDDAAEPPSRRGAAPLPPPKLSSPPRAAPPGPTPAPPARPQRALEQHHNRLEAEQRFEAGKRHLFAGDPALALPEFLEAARLLPSAAEYAVYAEWARFSLLERPGDRLLKRRDLHTLAVRALRQDASLTMAHYVLAELALLDGNEQGVRQAIVFAIRSDARHPLVQRFVKTHGIRP